MVVKQTTLSKYLEDQDEIMLVLVEHRCGAFLGVHETYVARGQGGPTGFPMVDRYRRPRGPGHGRRGPSTSPRVETKYSDKSGSMKWYAVVRCPCLPDGHTEKIGVDKLGSRSVTFPHKKWGRPIDLPVVTL
jgi:hypothetical protein